LIDSKTFLLRNMHIQNSLGMLHAEWHFQFVCSTQTEWK